VHNVTTTHYDAAVVPFCAVVCLLQTSTSVDCIITQFSTQVSPGTLSHNAWAIGSKGNRNFRS